MADSKNKHRSKWTREQTIVALNTYFTIPFKDSNARHPIVREIAALIDRSPAALNMKIGKRINQDFFRRMVISSYNNTCCITGISNPSLLEACHISDWSNDVKNRTNPHNGLSLTPTLHKAYDELLIAVTPDFIIKVSDAIFNDASMTESTRKFFLEINGRKIMMPARFAPSPDLLDLHFQKFSNR